MILVTQKQWDDRWTHIFHQIRVERPELNLQVVSRAASKWMEGQYGPRPAAEETPGPPWWVKLSALGVGVPMSFLNGLWAWLDGKKTVVGLIITVAAQVAGYLPAVLPFFGLEAQQVATIVGISATVLGVLHKVYKWLYKEDHP